MITITINQTENLSQVEEFMSAEIMRNPNLNGADYTIEIGDWVSVEGTDEYTGTALKTSIVNIINQ